jgi:hypothetical protein
MFIVHASLFVMCVMDFISNGRISPSRLFSYKRPTRRQGSERVLRAQPRAMRHTGVICAPGS